MVFSYFVQTKFARVSLIFHPSEVNGVPVEYQGNIISCSWPQISGRVPIWEIIFYYERWQGWLMALYIHREPDKMLSSIINFYDLTEFNSRPSQLCLYHSRVHKISNKYVYSSLFEFVAFVSIWGMIIWNHWKTLLALYYIWVEQLLWNGVILLWGCRYFSHI